MDETLSHRRLKSPRAAAFAGISFSVLFLASLVLIRTAVSVDPQDGGDWLARGLLKRFGVVVRQTTLVPLLGFERFLQGGFGAGFSGVRG